MARLTPNEIAFIAFAVRNDDAGDRDARWRDLKLPSYDKSKILVTKLITALLAREDAKDVFKREEQAYQREVNDALRHETNHRLDMQAARHNMMATTLRSLEEMIAIRTAYIREHPEKSASDVSKLTDSAAKWADKVEAGESLSADDRAEIMRQLAIPEAEGGAAEQPKPQNEGPIVVAGEGGRA